MRRRRNPDDPALLARVKLKITKSRSRVDVRAYDGAQMVGGAMFVRAPWTAQRHEKNVLESLSTEVSKPYQRKGLASLIYRTLTAQGFTIHPSSSQTWQGQQLWEGGRWPGKREVYQKRYPSTWKEKVATLRDNPDDAVLLGRLKGRVRQQLKRKDGSVWCSVSAVDGREEVAHLTLTIRGGAGRANGVWVADALRRRGVASWLYDWASRKLGVAIAHSEHQTADGAAFTRGRRRNPDDQDLLRRLTVETDDDPRFARGKVDTYVEFRAFDEGSLAATATFRVRRKYLEAIEVIVNLAWRRRGLASWLYRYAERETGMKVKHSKDQTTDGKAFARGRRRNPGDPKALEAELVRLLGVSDDACVLRAWILADGRIVDLDARDEYGSHTERDTHSAVADLFEKAGYEPLRGPEAVEDAHRTFMRHTGAIRLADGVYGSMLIHLERVPTAAQVSACGRIASCQASMEQDLVEIYWAPADRLVAVRPISAGKVRRILEALPGEPKTRSNPRRNPPRDVDTLEALGDECAVWAIAAATGRTVPEVRRAFLAGGDDIWLTKGGYGSGASMRQIRAVVKRLDFDHRIVGIGQALTLGNGPRAVFTQYQSDLFVRGRRRGQIGADEFDVPEGVKDDVTRSMGPEAAVREVDGVTTIGMLVDQAKRGGLSLLAVTVNARRSRGAYTFRGHIVGYAPGRGLYDTSVRSKTAVAKILDGKPSEVITGLDYAAHGDEVPQRMRPAVLWVFFKGK